MGLQLSASAGSALSLNQSVGIARNQQSPMELTYKIGVCGAQNLGATLKPFLDDVAAGIADRTTALALGIGGGVATNNFLDVQPLVKEVNRVLTARLNEITPGCDEWRALRPVQALWFGIYKDKLNKESEMGLVKDGVEAAFLKYPKVSAEDLPKVLTALLDKMHNGTPAESGKAMLKLGGLFYQHGKNEAYQNAMVDVLEFVTTSAALVEKLVVPGIISFIHCEATIDSERMNYIVSGTNVPNYMRAWPVAIADNIKHLKLAGGIDAESDPVVKAMFDVKVSEITGKDPLSERLKTVRKLLTNDKGRSNGEGFIAEIGQIGTVEDLPSLLKFINTPRFDADISLPVAVEAIREIGARGARKEAIEALITILKDPETCLEGAEFTPHLGLRAAEALATFGKDAQIAIPAIVEFSSRDAAVFEYRVTERGRMRARFGGNEEVAFPLPPEKANRDPRVVKNRELLAEIVDNLKSAQ